MSTKGHTSKHSTRSFHHRNDSQELDVFEAAKYFSGYNYEAPSGYNVGGTHREKTLKEELHKDNWRGGRMSLDVPMRHLITKQDQTLLQEKQVPKDKKYKQPSSPGRRLASFLNSLFKSKSNKDVNGGEESPGGGRRRRRSSISNFRSSSTNSSINIISDHSKSSSSSRGFRTPPPSVHTPTKSYKQVVCFTKPIKDRALDDQIRKMESLSWVDEKVKFEDGFLEKPINKFGLEEERDKFRNFSYNEGINDGAESDSSSDLFELQNYDLGLDVYASGLPVYETTHLDGIKRGNPNF